MASPKLFHESSTLERVVPGSSERVAELISSGEIPPMEKNHFYSTKKVVDALRKSGTKEDRVLADKLEGLAYDYVIHVGEYFDEA